MTVDQNKCDQARLYNRNPEGSVLALDCIARSWCTCLYIYIYIWEVLRVASEAGIHRCGQRRANYVLQAQGIITDWNSLPCQLGDRVSVSAGLVKMTWNSFSEKLIEAFPMFFCVIRKFSHVKSHKNLNCWWLSIGGFRYWTLQW